MELLRIVLIALCVFKCSGTLNDQCITNFVAKVIDCKDLTILKPFGNDNTDQVQTIKIDSCDIQDNTIGENDLRSFRSLNMLIINNSSLSVVGQSVFNTLRKLDAVVIENTELTLVHPGQFKNNGLLRKLYLSHNKITSIPEDVFPSSLRELDLSYNLISSISSFAFKDLQSLQQLKLTGNLLTSLRSDLRFPSFLKFLYLDFNDIEEVEPGTFSNCISLEELTLSFNRLHSVSENTFNGLYNLITLRLDNNLISDISLELFSQLDSLRYLFLHRNKLDHIHLNELQLNSILQLHIDNYLLEGNLNNLSYFAGFESILYIHIRVSGNQDIVLTFKSGCASEKCDGITKSINREVLRCPNEDTCFLKVPNVLGYTDDQTNGNLDYNNCLCKNNYPHVVYEMNYYILILWNNVVTYFIAFVLYLLHLMFKNKNKILGYILKSRQPDPSLDEVFIDDTQSESAALLPQTHPSSESQVSDSFPERPDVSKYDKQDTGQYSGKLTTEGQQSNRQESNQNLKVDTPRSGTASDNQRTESEFNAFDTQISMLSEVPATYIHYESALETSLSSAADFNISSVNTQRELQINGYLSTSTPQTQTTGNPKDVLSAFPQGPFPVSHKVSGLRGRDDTYYFQAAERQDSGTVHSLMPPQVFTIPDYSHTPPQAVKRDDHIQGVENSSVLARTEFQTTGRNSLAQTMKEQRAKNFDSIITSEISSDIPETLQAATVRNTQPQPPKRQDDTQSLKERPTISLTSTTVPTQTTPTSTPTTNTAVTTTATTTATTTTTTKGKELWRRKTTGDNPDGQELFATAIAIAKATANATATATTTATTTTTTTATTTTTKGKKSWRRKTTGDNPDGQELFEILKLRKAHVEPEEPVAEAPSQPNPNPLQRSPSPSDPQTLKEPAPLQSSPAASSGERGPNVNTPRWAKQTVSGLARHNSLPPNFRREVPLLTIVPRSKSFIGSGLGAPTPSGRNTAGQSPLTKLAMTHKTPRKGSSVELPQRVGSILNRGQASSKTRNLIDAIEGNGRH